MRPENWVNALQLTARARPVAFPETAPGRRVVWRGLLGGLLARVSIEKGGPNPAAKWADFYKQNGGTLRPSL